MQKQQQQAEYKSLLRQSQPQIMESFLVWFKNENMMLLIKIYWTHAQKNLANDGLILLAKSGVVGRGGESYISSFQKIIIGQSYPFFNQTTFAVR